MNKAHFSSNGNGNGNGGHKLSVNTGGLTVRKMHGSNKVAYPSNLTGQLIINAETGVPTKHRVGSSDEALYYKVADATNRNNTGDADIYFYDSPEHYIRHRFSRMKYRVKFDNPKRSKHDKMRKDELLANSEKQIIHWSLVDIQGVATDDINKAFMIPRVNPAYLARWNDNKRMYMAQCLDDSENDDTQSVISIE